MTPAANRRTVGGLLSAIMLASLAGPVTFAQAKPPLVSAIKRQASRDAYIRFETIVDALDVAPGMTILDIGAGPGYASFLFAEKLHGTGEVYATDIRRDFVDHIAGEAKRRGLANLSSALVKADGLDDFYGRHRYDIVFLSNVYHCLDGRVDYFTRLRGFLKPGARLVLVLYDQAPLFSADDLSDPDGLAGSIRGKAGDDPFVERLSPATRRLVQDGGDKAKLRSALVEDFNRMLVDPGFYKGFYKDSYFTKGLFTPAERDFANWLLMTLRDDGALDGPADRTDERTRRSVIRLNRLFFAARFGAYLADEGRGAYVPAGDANRQTSKSLAIRELDAAGYKPATEIRLSPYFEAVIMVPKAP